MQVLCLLPLYCHKVLELEKCPKRLTESSQPVMKPCTATMTELVLSITVLEAYSQKAEFEAAYLPCSLILKGFDGNRAAELSAK